MAKVHIVREAFSIDGTDYPRGAEITDCALVKRVSESHPGHVVPLHHEAAEAPKVEAKASTKGA